MSPTDDVGEIKTNLVKRPRYTSLVPANKGSFSMFRGVSRVLHGAKARGYTRTVPLLDDTTIPLDFFSWISRHT